MVPLPSCKLRPQVSGRRVQTLGGSVTSRGLLSAALPPWLQSLTARIARDTEAWGPATEPNHVLVNAYEPGMGIQVSLPRCRRCHGGSLHAGINMWHLAARPQHLRASGSGPVCHSIRFSFDHRIPNVSAAVELHAAGTQVHVHACAAVIQILSLANDTAEI